MSLINVRLIEGVFDADEKTQMVEKLTETMVEIEGENMRGVTWVVIDEVKSGDWGIGGQSLTTEAGHALQAGVPALPWPSRTSSIPRGPSSRARAAMPTSMASAPRTRSS